MQSTNRQGLQAFTPWLAGGEIVNDRFNLIKGWTSSIDNCKA